MKSRIAWSEKWKGAGSRCRCCLVGFGTCSEGLPLLANGSPCLLISAFQFSISAWSGKQSGCVTMRGRIAELESELDQARFRAPVGSRHSESESLANPGFWPDGAAGQGEARPSKCKPEGGRAGQQ